MALRIGADVGGTFTDVVLERDDGSFVSAKVLTTHRPEEGVLAAVATLAAGNDVDLANVAQIIHGTTLATNALIERSGARTALVTTAGFRDVIETRTESRFEQYDLNIELPAPLIERKDRFVVAERLNARGEVLRPFDEPGARAVVERLVEGGYESVAVGFMHSYRNGAHERRFRDLLSAAAPDIAVSLSSEVSPRMREYERFNTTCANAYVQPLMAGYLRRLASELRRIGATCPLFLIHSGGGLLSVEVAASFPVRLVESGPAGGAVFAADLAARHGRDRILSFDMGGTTAKIALIEGAAPRTAAGFEVARTARFKKGSGMPISIPVIEMLEIGAGGGSIARLDALARIGVGPQSAGSDPGPAAYGRGGTEPTVTDADVCLGRLHPDTFGAKDISLAPDRAVAALDSVAAPLGLDTTAAAVGVVEVTDENMANAARVHATEHGQDVAGYSVVAFGGGAPLHAGRLLDKLGLAEVLVPPGAGVGSAIGFLLAPFSYEATRTFYTALDRVDGLDGLDGSDGLDGIHGPERSDELDGSDGLDDSGGPDDSAGPAGSLDPDEPGGSGGLQGLDDPGGFDGSRHPDHSDGMNGPVKSTAFDAAGVNTVLDELAAEAEAFVRRGTTAEVTVQRQASMRYRGQGWEIPVVLPPGRLTAAALQAAFDETYVAHFGRVIDDLPAEAVSWSVQVTSQQPPPTPVEPMAAGAVGAAGDATSTSPQAPVGPMAAGDATSTSPQAPVGPMTAGAGDSPAASPAAQGFRRVVDPATGRAEQAGIVMRAALMPGQQVVGPALIVEDQTTTVLGPHHAAVVAADGTLIIRPVNPAALSAHTTPAGATAGGAEQSDTETGPEGTSAAAPAPAAAPRVSSRPDGSHPGVESAPGSTSAPAPASDSGSESGTGGASASAGAAEVRLQVMWNRLLSVVDEQARTLVRTAFATSVREAGDLSAGVFDRAGRMIAQAVTGTPGHVNTMAAAVGHFISDIGPANIHPGDVYLTNDPWKGTGHLHDFTFTTPVFVGAELVGFFAATAHVVDIGGRGWGPDATEVYEEGLRIPIMKWADRGRLNRDLINIVRHNVRAADHVIGDLHGLAACNEIGRRRLLAMFDEFGIDSLDELAAFVFARTRHATLSALAAVTPGVYRNHMRVDGYGEPVDLHITLTVTPEGMHADFAGTSAASPLGINVPLTYAGAYFTYGMLVALAPELPNNAASLQPFTVSAPPGSILNAVAPAPVAVRHVIGHFVTDLSLGALAEALPDVVPAEGSGAIWNFQASARSASRPACSASGDRAAGRSDDGEINRNAPSPRAAADQCSGDLVGTPGEDNRAAIRGASPRAAGRGADPARTGAHNASPSAADPGADRPPVEILMFNSGGTGARPGSDGLTATAFPSGVMTMSVEATEQVGPIVVWRKEIRPGSGGAGRRRGGLGQVIEIAPTDGYQFEFAAMFDRIDNPARGRAGGGDGACGRVHLDDGTPFAAKGRHTVPAGRRLILELPGGGGFGDPAERDPAATANDHLQGYL